MRIIDNVRPDRQTVMFSATFPRQMEALARKILNKPVEVQVGGRSVVCKDVTQSIVRFLFIGFQVLKSVIVQTCQSVFKPYISLSRLLKIQRSIVVK